MNIAFNLIGALGMFLFGMKSLSEALRLIAGDNMKKILHKLTNNSVVGVGVGSLITFFVQSSSVTTVMVIGLVNASLMTLRQAIGVIMGANIGTTITAQIIAFKISKFGLPAIGIGFAMMLLLRRQKFKYFGQIVFSFGLIFYGLMIMSHQVAPLKEHQAVMDLFVQFSSNTFTAVLVGMLITMLIQSSSATVGITMALAFNGLIDFQAAVGLVLGENIGTTVTAQLASIGSGVSARRAAWVHTLFNLFGMLYMIPLVKLGLYPRFIEMVTPSPLTQDTIMRHIANAHTFFNVINTIVLLPFVFFLEKAARFIVRGETEEEYTEPKYLDRNLINTPSLALVQAKKEVINMCSLAEEAIHDAMGGFFSGKHKQLAKVAKKEEGINELQKRITEYLVEVSQEELSIKASEQLPVFFHTVNDIERIGDHAVNLSEIAERVQDKKLPFSAKAIEEIKDMYSNVTAMMKEVLKGLEKEDISVIKKAMKREIRIDKLQLEYRDSHLKRLKKKQCHMQSGFLFVDIINNFEKIGDHLTNIAQAVEGSFRFDKIAKPQEKKPAARSASR